MTPDSSSNLRFDRKRVPSCKMQIQSASQFDSVLQAHQPSSSSAFVPSCPVYSELSILPPNEPFQTHLRVPQQFQDPSLICRESSNLPNHRSHKLGLGGLHALALAGADGLGDGSCGMSLVEAGAEVCTSQFIGSEVRPPRSKRP